MLPIGFGSMHVQAGPVLEDKFDRTLELGGAFIEFYYEEMEKANYGAAEYARIRALSNRLQVPVTYHCSWDPPCDLGRYDVQQGAACLRGMIEPGLAIGAQFLIAHLGAYHGNAPMEQSLAKLPAMLEAVYPALAAQGAVLCLENNTSLYTPRAMGCGVFEMDYIFARLDSPHVAMCLDTGHAHVNGCLTEMTERMASRIRYIHLHDNDGVSDLHTAPGMGNIPWEKWYARLARLPQRPWVMFEYPRSQGFERPIKDIRRHEAAVIC